MTVEELLEQANRTLDELRGREKSAGRTRSRWAGDGASPEHVKALAEAGHIAGGAPGSHRGAGQNGRGLLAGMKALSEGTLVPGGHPVPAEGGAEVLPL